MPAIECLLGSLFYAIGKPIVEAAVPGIIGNRADAFLCGGIRKAWKSIQSSTPANHSMPAPSSPKPSQSSPNSECPANATQLNPGSTVSNSQVA